MKSESIIITKSKAFAIRIIKLYQFLNDEKKEFVMSKQILKSGTSIGANAKEAARAQSKMDFIHKNSIALKEASETEYWLELLCETDYITSQVYDSLNKDNIELIRMLTACIKTTKENLEENVKS